VLIAGCGSGAKTVSVSSSPLESNTTTQTTSSKTSATSTSTTQTEAETQRTTTEQASTSRTSSAPAFVEQEEGSGGPLAAAVATVERAGYVPNDTAQYRASQTLRVLIGAKAGASEATAYGEQAFFFIDGSYIGTDAAKPSAAIKLVSQSDTEVVLSYGLYDSAGAGSGEAEVHFQLDNGKLEALDPIPPVRANAHADGRL
jgi:hypothetical protein